MDAAALAKRFLAVLLLATGFLGTRAPALAAEVKIPVSLKLPFHR